MTTTLTLTFLGAPQLVLAQQPLAGQVSGKTLALFSYIATTRGPHQRDQLADLLWSELPHQQSRSNLRYLLSDLRQVVGNYLTITPQTISFNPQQPYWLDVEVLYNNLETKPPFPPISARRAALDLYRGEFLAGFSVRNAPVFEGWATTQRNALHTLAVQGWYRLAEEYWQTRSFEAGLTATQRLLLLEPWHEAGHRLRMLLLAHTGQRAAALTQFAECQQLLADELGAAPEEATLAVYQQIRTGDYHPLPREQAPGMCSGFPGPQPASSATQNPGHQPMIALPVPTPPSAQQPANKLIRHNLPGQLTPFIGRQQEATQLCALLADSTHRLLTLTGLGGIGKTRLALAVGQAFCRGNEPPGPRCQTLFRDGVWFVSLLGVNAGENLASRLAVAIADALQLPRSGPLHSADQLFDELRNRELLLILDNFEHLTGGADFVLDLLRRTTAVKLLITSRLRLNLPAEFVWPLAGLTVPALEAGLAMTPGETEQYDSVRLLIERAQRVNRAFRLDESNQAPILHICHFVAGLPLGIELAAAMTRQTNCHQLWQAIRQDYTVLATTLRDIPARHHTLKAMLNSSWWLLTEAQRRVLVACAVFPQAFTLEAAISIADATPALLAALCDHSLLRQTATGRFELHEIVRHYVRQLDQDPQEQEERRRRHVAYYSSLIEPDAGELLRSPTQLRLVKEELPNLQLVLTWSIEHQQMQPLLCIGEGLFLHFLSQGPLQEGWDWLDAAITMLRHLPALATKPAELRFLALALAAQAYLGYYQGRYADVIRLGQEAISLASQFNDARTLAMAHGIMGMVAFVQGEFAEHERQCCTALQYAHAGPVPYLIAVNLAYWALGLAIQERLAEALNTLQEALDIVHQQGLVVLEGYVLSELSFVYAMSGDWALADGTTQQALQLSEALDSPLNRGYQYARLALAAEAIGEYARAVAWTDQALAFAKLVPDPQNGVDVLLIRGRSLRHLGDLPGAEQALFQLVSLAQALPRPAVWVKAQIELGHIAQARQAWQSAETYYCAALELAKGSNPACLAVAQAGLARLCFQQNQLSQATAWAEQAVTLLLEQPLESQYGATVAALICYYALAAAQDPRAQLILKRAVTWVEAQAAKISDATLRRSFSENVPCHRQLIALLQVANG